MKLLVCLSLPALASAFLGARVLPTAAPTHASTTKGRTVTMESISEFLKFDAKLGELEVTKAGVSLPLGFFDPLGFYNGKTIRQKKKLRESELKHGRVAMLAVLGIFVQEAWHPLLAGDVGTAIDQFNGIEDIVPDFYAGALFFFSLFEFKSIAMGWDPISETLSKPKIAGIRDDYVTGNLEWDPIGFCPDDDEAFIKMRTKELNNGRMAMIAVIGIIGQELATGTNVVTSLFG